MIAALCTNEIEICYEVCIIDLVRVFTHFNIGKSLDDFFLNLKEIPKRRKEKECSQLEYTEVDTSFFSKNSSCSKHFD